MEYAVFGAVALGLHGLARATADVDLFIAPDAANVERLKAALRTVFKDPNIEDIAAEDLVPALATTGREASRSTWRIGRDTRMEISTSIRIVPTRVGLPQRAKAQDSRSSRHGLHQAPVEGQHLRHDTEVPGVVRVSPWPRHLLDRTIASYRHATPP